MNSDTTLDTIYAKLADLTLPKKEHIKYERYKCFCGATCTYTNRCHHNKSKPHIRKMAYLQELKKDDPELYQKYYDNFNDMKTRDLDENPTLKYSLLP